MNYKNTKRVINRLAFVILVVAVLRCSCLIGICKGKSATEPQQQQATSRRLGKLSGRLAGKKEKEIWLILAEIGVGLTIGTTLLTNLWYTVTKHKRK
ncbi:MAG: hypothetical protein LBB04_02380 [Oscillospiraceae bacterium]|jgi:hypothetical protein|nr:hypothetical protein [Oscillospiraceae bacterium]